MFERGGEREALDALRAPLGGDLVAGRAPDLLGVALEEGEVELAAEAVDEEVFEGLFFADGAHARGDVADADARHAHRAEVRDGRAAELDGVVEKFAQIVDAALARADEHDEVGVGGRGGDDGRGDRGGIPHLRIEMWGTRIGGQFVGEWAEAAQGRLLRQMRGNSDDALLALVADLGVGRFGRHQVHPPLHHAVGLGEEAVAADVHAVALVTDGARDAADLLRGLQHDGRDVRVAKELQSGGEAGGTGTNDDGSSRHASIEYMPSQKGKDERNGRKGKAQWTQCSDCAGTDNEGDRSLRVGVQRHVVAVQHGAVEDLHRQRVLHQALDGALERARSVGAVVAGLEDRRARRVGEFKRDVAVG